MAWFSYIYTKIIDEQREAQEQEKEQDDSFEVGLSLEKMKRFYLGKPMANIQMNLCT